MASTYQWTERARVAAIKLEDLRKLPTFKIEVPARHKSSRMNRTLVFVITTAPNGMIAMDQVERMFEHGWAEEWLPTTSAQQWKCMEEGR
jgi:hypothetical protein